MSTYLYLECLDHDPPLRAEDESGQHLKDLPRIRLEIAERVALADEWAEARHEFSPYGPFDQYFRAHSGAFLSHHRKCRIGIRDEYGDAHPAEAP